MLGIVKSNFIIYLTPDSFVVLYKAMIRSQLEYAVNNSGLCNTFLLSQCLDSKFVFQ